MANVGRPPPPPPPPPASQPTWLFAKAEVFINVVSILSYPSLVILRPLLLSLSPFFFYCQFLIDLPLPPPVPAKVVSSYPILIPLSQATLFLPFTCPPHPPLPPTPILSQSFLLLLLFGLYPILLHQLLFFLCGHSRPRPALLTFLPTVFPSLPFPSLPSSSPSPFTRPRLIIDFCPVGASLPASIGTY